MLEKVSLLQTKEEFLKLALLFFTLLFFSLSLEYYHFKELTKFDSQLVNATVLKQYTKTKIKKSGKKKSYQVLKLKTAEGFRFYTTASQTLQNIKHKNVQLEVWAGDITFYEYMHGFFAFSKIVQIYPDNSYKTKLNEFIDSQHSNRDISLLYQALFSAKELPFRVQKQLSDLGISHLIAISGFHLGVLSLVLLFILKYPYKFLQNRLFPFRSYKRDSFFIIATLLLIYLLFLEMPPSLLRAYVMFVIGFILYDRAVEILSMQTLFLTILFILSLSPRLIFSIGFWLSVSGVFYIFLFLIYFKELTKRQQFFLLPLWIYFFMLPYSLLIFGNFSLYHPLSIILTMLFSIFYPLSAFLHIIGFGNLFDNLLAILLEVDTHSITLSLSKLYTLLLIPLSLLSIFYKPALYAVAFTSLLIMLQALFALT